MPAKPAPIPVGESAPVPSGSGHLGAGETAVVITAIAAVTVLTVLERPVPTVLTALACLLLAPAWAGRLLTALTTGGRG
ncbi:hypothetical protein [Streptomyces sp. NPDC058861]|uniref:hypothetical protein n=1 Tax=Streptomyces sp. NPDC058861 TaxID=3346653 RepID=UPI003679B20D